MKIGDKIPVNIGNHTVAQAEVKEMSDGTATLIVPATLVVMGTRTDLTDLPSDNTGTEVIVDEVERTVGTESVVESTETPVEAREQNQATSESETNEAPVVEDISSESSEPVESSNSAESAE